ncbi:MAG TPA: XdhC family protein, partial [Ktedonobacteraceae bacterium]|nr:XdhC family protein [Ktedonobacteraceae bacterium]
MSGVYEALKDLLDQEKGAALATLVRGDEHVGAKLLVLPGKKSSGSLGNAALDALVLEDAEHAIW